MKLLDDFLRLIYPDCCEVCGRALVDGERLLCTTCDMTMPRTNFHRQHFSDIAQRVAAPGLPVERTASMFHYYRGNPYAELIKRGKYNNRPDIIRHLGARFSRELAAEGFFDDIDVLLPIPLSRMKLLKRGYNQTYEIARGISSVTATPIADNLVVRGHASQTHMSAAQRASNVAGIIKVIAPDELSGRHVLVIDDVITTGATMLSALTAIHTAVPSARMSFLTLGAAHLL